MAFGPAVSWRSLDEGVRDGPAGRRGRPSEIQRTHRAKWFHRISFPGNAVLGLGEASETWRSDLAQEWESYSRLLADVAEAAAAVEYTAEKIHRAIATAEAYYVPYLPALLAGPEPERGRHASHPAIADAYSEFANLLWWIRALDDRLGHGYRGARGLLPALAPGRLHDRARVLSEEFRRILAKEAGYLANYSLHHSTIPYAFNSSARVVDERLELPIPNRPSPQRRCTRIATSATQTVGPSRRMPTRRHPSS